MIPVPPKVLWDGSRWAPSSPEEKAALSVIAALLLLLAVLLILFRSKK